MNNIDKIMQYIQLVQKSPTVIDGKVYNGNIRSIQLGVKFFQKDSCLSCGACDVREANVYTQYEFDKILECRNRWEDERKSTCEYLDVSEDNCPLLTLNEYDQFIKDCKPSEINVNGAYKTIYVHPLRVQKVKLRVKDKPTEQCTWTTEVKTKPGVFVCKIHPVVSITCVMPHLVIRRSQSGIVRINTMQFGRNWALHCPVCFHDPVDENEFNEIKQSKINKLIHLKHCAESLEIDTYLDDVVNYIDNVPYEHYEDYLEKDIVCRSISAESWLQKEIKSSDGKEVK